MGQSRKNSRRGGSRWAGYLPPLGPAQWSYGIIGTVLVTVNWPLNPPPPATHLHIVLRLASSGAIVKDVYTTDHPYLLTGLTAGTAYVGVVALATAGANVSEWSDRKPVTTAT